MFTKITKKKEHHTAKNKNLEAVYITHENVDEIESETRAFTKFNDNCLLVGVMAFQRLPVWMICLNPKSKRRKYIFESENVFEKYFELEKEDEYD